jgi:predicted MPP superfamily phosphohydrolase
VIPDVGRALARVPPGAFTIALAHNPALWPELASRGVPLTLSGHTHHGQLSIPRLGWSLASLFLEHSMGTYRRGGSMLYINPGTNFWGIPLRIGALPEVTVVTLRRGPRSD